MAEVVHGVRRFESVEEVMREPSFRPDEPITVESYQLLGGWSSFTGDRVQCCCARPTGTLCGRKHGRGWVAQRKDGIATLIGGDCAADKFAAGSIALEDMRRADNEIARLEREGRLQTLLADRDAKIHELESLIGELKQLLASLGRLATEVGPSTWARIRIQALSGSTQVTVQGFTPAIRDKGGDVISPRKDVRITVGSLPGVRACAPGRIEQELRALSQLRHSYAAQLPEEGPKRATAVKALNATLGGHSQQVELARRLLADGHTFANADLEPIIFLERDPGGRVKLAQLVHRRGGVTLGRSLCKEWLQKRDREITATHGVAKLHL